MMIRGDSAGPIVPESAAALLREGRIEEGLRELRAVGFPMLHAIRAVHETTGRSLEESKRTVHFSDAWADTRGERDAFYSELDESVGALVDETESADPK